jgi:hypothetical protein
MIPLQAEMISYTIDSESGLVRARMAGATTLVSLVSHISNLAKDPQFNPSMNLIFEVEPEATFSLLPVEVEFRNLIKQWASRRKGARWAFWVPFGATYSHLQFAIGTLDQQDVQMRLFENEQSAIQWLVGGESSD